MRLHAIVRPAAERIPGIAVLDGLVLDLPIVPADTPSLMVPAK